MCMCVENNKNENVEKSRELQKQNTISRFFGENQMSYELLTGPVKTAGLLASAILCGAVGTLGLAVAYAQTLSRPLIW